MNIKFYLGNQHIISINADISPIVGQEMYFNIYSRRELPLYKKEKLVVDHVGWSFALNAENIIDPFAKCTETFVEVILSRSR